jgi:hypothetical protein
MSCQSLWLDEPLPRVNTRPVWNHRRKSTCVASCDELSKLSLFPAHHVHATNTYEYVCKLQTLLHVIICQTWGWATFVQQAWARDELSKGLFYAAQPLHTMSLGNTQRDTCNQLSKYEN